MIQQRSVLKVIDNSGAKTVRCLKVLGGFKKKYANLGDFIIVSVQQLRNKLKKDSKVKKKEVHRALIVKIKTNIYIKNGVRLKFNENAVILLNKQNSPIGTRVLGPLPKLLNRKDFQKIVSISSGLI